jgi:folylpolyglutamate synthase/dihydropteroate synthase
MLRLLAPAVGSLHTARAAGSARARPPEEVAGVGAGLIDGPVSSHHSVAEALQSARQTGGPVLVAGSLYVAGEARTALGLEPAGSMPGRRG